MDFHFQTTGTLSSSDVDVVPTFALRRQRMQIELYCVPCGTLGMRGRVMDKARVIHAWVVASVKDFYISFEFEAENRWHEYSTFFCHQGLEKICKAYIIARSASTWDHLPENQALVQVNKIAKHLGHDLKTLISCLQSENVLPRPTRNQKSSKNKDRRAVSYSQDDLVMILQAAYIEARYPIPKSSQIHRRYPLSNNDKIFSYPLGETAPIKYARKTALAVLNKIGSEFSILIPQDKKCLSSQIRDDSWEKFQNVFFNEVQRD